MAVDFAPASVEPPNGESDLSGRRAQSSAPRASSAKTLGVWRLGRF